MRGKIVISTVLFLVAGLAVRNLEAVEAGEDSSVVVGKNPHETEKKLTPDEFGRDLFTILKNEDYKGAQKYLWHEEDWEYVAKLGSPTPKEKQEKTTKQIKEKLHEGITRYHATYFQTGSPYRGSGDPIRSVEYMGFTPGRKQQPTPEYTNYNDSYLHIRINGSIEARLEIDHIQVINGVWHISEIK